jgi:hypothetical protein
MSKRRESGLVFVLILLMIFPVIMYGGRSWGQVSYIPPYARLSLSYFDGSEYKLSDDVDKGSLHGKSVPLSNFGVRLAYGISLDHQTRLQMEGSFLLTPLNKYEWKNPPGLGLTSKSLSFEVPGSQTLIHGVLSAYYDFERLNPYKPGSWSPYIGGGLGMYGLWWPQFDLSLADALDSSSKDYVSADVLDSAGEKTGSSQGVSASNRKSEFLLGPVGLLELGLSYNFSYVIVDGYWRMEYLYSLAQGRDSVFMSTLNIGVRF